MAFAGFAGFALAGALGSSIAVSALSMLGVVSTGSQAIQRQLDLAHAARLRHKREDARKRSLQLVGAVRRQQYSDLYDLVGDIERLGPSEAERFELQDLLDHFVHLATMQKRYLDAVEIADSSVKPTEEEGSSQRLAIFQRRMRHRDECKKRSDRISEELDSIRELVRLVAQRVACPESDVDLDHEIERRLWGLDAADEAQGHLDKAASGG
jgi:hypothetical protein